MKQAALSICFPTAAEQRVLHQMLLLHPLKIQIVAEETEQTNSLKHHAELSQWVFRHAALVAAQGTNTAVLYYLLHTTDYSAPVLNALLVALCHSLFTPLTRTRQNSLVLSWPSFQFATVQSQILAYWGLLTIYRYRLSFVSNFDMMVVWRMVYCTVCCMWNGSPQNIVGLGSLKGLIRPWGPTRPWLGPPLV